jgi:hypothetical protein
MKTNLDRMHKEPGMLWMLISLLRQESQLSTPSHAVSYDDNKTTFNTHSLECTTGNLLQMRSQLHHDM